MRAVVLVGWLVACGGAEPTEGPRAFVAADGALFTAVVGDARSAVAYRCDGDESAATHSEWFTGDASGDGAFALASKADEAEVEFGDGEAVLTFGDGSSVTAEEIDAEATDAGLFRAEGDVDGEPFVVGWILAPDGEQRGAIGLSTSGVLFGVSPLGPERLGVTVQIDASAVEVDVVNATTMLGG